jgi:hypothetical protein
MLLQCSLEIHSDCFLQRLLVGGEHARHAVDLFDTPFKSAGYAGAEEILLCIEEFLVQIYACDPD